MKIDNKKCIEIIDKAIDKLNYLYGLFNDVNNDDIDKDLKRDFYKFTRECNLTFDDFIEDIEVGDLDEDD